MSNDLESLKLNNLNTYLCSFKLYFVLSQWYSFSPYQYIQKTTKTVRTSILRRQPTSIRKKLMIRMITEKMWMVLVMRMDKVNRNQTQIVQGFAWQSTALFVLLIQKLERENNFLTRVFSKFLISAKELVSNTSLYSLI